MTGYDLKQLRDDLENWAANRFLPAIPFLEGGWEAWIQIDFPAYLSFKNGLAKHLPYDFSREVRVPGVGRLDWVVNGHQGTGTADNPIVVDEHWPRAAVEIKAQSVGYNNMAFAALVAKDIAKLGVLPTLYPHQYQHRIMLVAVIDEGAITALKNQLATLAQPFLQNADVSQVDVIVDSNVLARLFLIELKP